MWVWVVGVHVGVGCGCEVRGVRVDLRVYAWARKWMRVRMHGKSACGEQQLRGFTL